MTQHKTYFDNYPFLKGPTDFVFAVGDAMQWPSLRGGLRTGVVKEINSWGAIVNWTEAGSYLRSLLSHKFIQKNVTNFPNVAYTPPQSTNTEGGKDMTQDKTYIDNRLFVTKPTDFVFGVGDRLEAYGSLFGNRKVHVVVTKITRDAVGIGWEEAGVTRDAHLTHWYVQQSTTKLPCVGIDVTPQLAETAGNDGRDTCMLCDKPNARSSSLMGTVYCVCDNPDCTMYGR